LVHTDILGKLQVLYSEINRRVASSKDTIAELECRLKSVNDIDISEEEEMFNLIKKVNHLIVEYIKKCIFTCFAKCFNRTIIYADLVVN
jgi:hypothetical protein